MQYNHRDFLELLGRGHLGILSLFSIKVGKQLNENVSKFLLRVSRITCCHIILCNLTLKVGSCSKDDNSVHFFYLSFSV